MKRVHERNLGAALLAAISVGVACFEVANPPVPVLLRAALAIPLLLAPGYALGTALFPPGRLSNGEWWAVAGGLGLATVILTGLILDTVPGGLDRSSWSIALAGVSLCAAGVGLVTARRGGVTSHLVRRRRAGGIVVAAIVLLGTFAGLGVARQSATAHDRLSRFTELWALQGGARQRGAAIHFGVRNDEGVVESYRIVAISGGGKPLFRLPPFRLRPGGTKQWTRTVQSVRRVILRLFKPAAARGGPYRRVMIWIPQ